MFIDVKELDQSKLANFRLKVFKSKGYCLLTNEVGEYCFLKSKDFKHFIEGNTEKLAARKLKELNDKSFLRNSLDFERLIHKYVSRNKSLSNGPSLHIIVVTLRCDHGCVYCQASSKTNRGKGWDMDKQTANKVVRRMDLGTKIVMLPPDHLFQHPHKSWYHDT